MRVPFIYNFSDSYCPTTFIGMSLCPHPQQLYNKMLDGFFKRLCDPLLLKEPNGINFSRSTYMNPWSKQCQQNATPFLSLTDSLDYLLIDLPKILHPPHLSTNHKLQYSISDTLHNGQTTILKVSYSYYVCDAAIVQMGQNFGFLGYDN